MITYSFAELPKWATKTKKVMDAVVSHATDDMIADIKVVPGINRGGGRVKGTIPRDDGALASSLQSSLNNSTAISGETSFALFAGRMKAGDTARFAWGGNVAPHAEAVHYGAKGVPGTFFIDVAASKWRGYVKAAAAKAKRELG